MARYSILTASWELTHSCISSTDKFHVCVQSRGGLEDAAGDTWRIWSPHRHGVSSVPAIPVQVALPRPVDSVDIHIHVKYWLEELAELQCAYRE